MGVRDSGPAASTVSNAGAPQTTTAPAVRKKTQGKGDPKRDCFTIVDVTKHLSRGGDVILDDISLNFHYGAKIGILGMNGAGKSTLMKIIAGIDDEHDGEVVIFSGMKLGYLPQEPTLDESKTVKENVVDGVADQVEILEDYYQKQDQLKDEPENLHLKEEFEALERKVKKDDLLTLQWRIERALWALRCPPPDSPVTNLSGGEIRRVALARLLISEPDILLLDEPTNHLDANSVAWLEQFLSTYKGTVLAITHDRYFLDNVSGWILEVENGKVHPFDGNYSEWLVYKQKRLQMLAKKEKVMERHLKKELEWIKKSPNARQAKSKARIGRYEELREKHKLREYEAGSIMIPAGPRLGNKVLEVKNLTKSVVQGISATENVHDYPEEDKRVLIDDLTFSLPPGAIMGVIGPNGSGKTTFLKILTEKIPPDSGSVEFGATVNMALVSQDRESLDPTKTVFEEIAQGRFEVELGDDIINTRQYVAGFNFKSRQQEKYIGDLSGGERNRVHIAKLMMENANVLLLDEPTNDIDVEVLRSLEEGIQSFPGSLIIVSHDRWFLDRVCTHILAFEGSDVQFFEGNYSQYERQRKREGKNEQGTKFITLKKKGT
eukprot:TRINITY_DN284_c1_g1_i1.p1 TRINITY_DN284_c1_g1~~TRINITY_DN284_c1_g1_i1.p1  ORF type:complete len:606 (-),score=158.49 TRINITY_DN284_c1_g1_i1:44-1861(-)